MRRVTEVTASAPTPSVGSAFIPMSWREIAPYAGFAATCYLIAPYLGLSSFDVSPKIAEVWPPGGVGFVLLTTIWFAGRRVIAATVVFMAVVFAATALTLDYSPAYSGWMALVGALQPLLMVWLYRRWLSHDGWAPESPMDVAALIWATVLTSVLLGLVGGFATLDPTEFTSRVLAWWVLRNTVFSFVGGVTFLVMFYGRRRGALDPSGWFNRVALVLTAMVCVYGSYHDPSLPLSWLLIIPSVWGGLTLTVRGTAGFGLFVALLAASMSYLPQNQFGYEGLLPPSSIMDLLVIASAGFTLLLTLMREQRGALILELDGKRRESEGQRRLLEKVFNSMSDGVIIVEESHVAMYNAAARQLLGRPLPSGVAGSWARELGLRTVEGLPLTDEMVREALSSKPDDASAAASPAKKLEVLVSQDGAARILNLNAQPMESSEVRSTMVLLQDVTAQRARLRELSNFAGMVAHDLRGPLTVLDGWLEVVEDGDPVTDAETVEDAVLKARESSRRMRQVIEDWLNYTVVQNGQLRPEAIKLFGVTFEIVDGRRASWPGDDEPQFVLDLEHSVMADPGLLRQLLDNLVGNAIKYTAPEQRPWVMIRSTNDEEPGWVRVDVVDRGVGIPEGEEELIFEEFHRGPTEGRSAGTGLGLALTRRIVGLHGGHLEARRNPEGGSTFSFTLPEA
jgi:signal transduction histidine kinase